MELNSNCNVKTRSWESICFLVLRLFLGALFIISSIPKISALNQFTKTVYQFKLLPEFFVPYFSVLLPIIELFLGLCLCLGIYIRWSARALSLLVLSFIGAITINLIRGVSINCGCFGNLFNEVLGWEALARDFLLLGLLIFLTTKKRFIFAIQ